MKTKIIKTEPEFEAAVARIGELMDAAPGSPEEEELELLGLLVDEYQKQYYPISLPDPVDAIKFRMDQQGLTRKDLIPYIGSQSKVSEVLNRKRPLSLSMIRALEKGLGIPAEVLIQEPGSRGAEETPAEDEPQASAPARRADAARETSQEKLQAILTLLQEIAPVVRDLAGR